MKWLATLFAKAAPSALAWGLSLAVPAIPSGVWLAIINGVIGGYLTLEHIQAFLAAHNVKTYYAPTDFPQSPPQNGAVNNLGPQEQQ